ncbi:anthranilate synthase component I family protein [Streptomyces sp. PKU-MA01144]|uniref:anthranilate synthase component I family protein n=1 Tax=Streptomyces sp. PKU-MA01144 TaxID=2729138 RepID=UPI00147B472C|nr:anthranilate synthase component I family protein [Streptomyces sp. PKU-MA01144]NNJ08408.1 anthranilate synthase component I family protein [Streptomyces sp. PKU-MA01144]
MTDPRPAPASIRVTTRTHTLPPVPMLPAYRSVTARFGPDEVYLLESAGGPIRDRRYQVVGFKALLSVAVTDGVVRVEGVPALRRPLLERIRPLLHEDAGGTLRLRTLAGLWPLLRAVQALFDAEGSSHRFRFGFLGYFGYDTVRYVEELPYLIEQRPDLPDVQIVLHQGCVVRDLADGRTELLLHESDAWPPLAAPEITALLEHAEHTHPEPDADTFPESAVSDDTDPEAFRRDVGRCLEHIAIGDIYQVQIGHELAMRSDAAPVEVYQRLRRRNASPYMYLASVGGQCVIGASPELFVRIEDGVVTMRPIAGTLPRTGDDEAAAERLSSDPKEIAEHTMLVDLCRNDIGRIARADSLAVPDEFVVERYSHVLHLVSTVVGQAEPDKDAFDAVAALFPAGTMTGTPKIRAMEIIESLEHSRRGLYAGALGLIDVGGYTNLALCIRTLFHRDGVYRTRASAGIVADSDPASEWRETLAKMSAAHWAVTGKELL